MGKKETNHFFRRQFELVILLRAENKAEVGASWLLAAWNVPNCIMKYLWVMQELKELYTNSFM